ncbi:hypothetical protein ACVWY5_001531 [Bradyrhizobium sp. USDA 3256]
MEHAQRIEAIQARMAEQIETIARVVCEDKEPLTAELVLRALATQMAHEDARPAGVVLVKTREEIRTACAGALPQSSYSASEYAQGVAVASARGRSEPDLDPPSSIVTRTR